MESIEMRSDFRSKLIPANTAQVFAAMSDPTRIARWWGPAGFSNTIQTFEFKPGGAWHLTMHGPDGKSYPNENRFTRIIDNQILEVEHLREPHFTLTIELDPEGKGTRVRWRQIFDTAEKYDKLSQFIALANEQNLERLSMEVQRNQSTA